MTVTPVLANQTNVKEPDAQAIDWVWSGQRVWFDFISQGNYQLVAYYDSARQMSVAVREMGDINGAPWIYQKVPSFLGWDAHNKVVAAFDKHGYIHVAGNIHANPLVYFRSKAPYNPRTLVQENIMVSADREQQMTYPDFFVDPIPVHGGLLNGGTPIGFDRDNNVVVVYQKYDQGGNSQVYLSRNMHNVWQSVQVSN